MKNVLLILLLICMSISSHFGKCDEKNSILLVKSKERDWIKNYNNLFEKYKNNNNVSVSTLRSFFYTGKKASECISFEDLQKLDKKLHEIFSSVNPNDDVKKFIVAVKNAATKNKPTKTEPQTLAINKEEYSAQDSISKSIEPTVTESDLINKLNQDNSQLVEERDKLKEDRSIWFSISMGLLVLLISSILYLYWYFSKKIEANKESSQNALKEQSLYFNKTMKELEVKNRENRNSFREESPRFETKKDVIIPIEETKKIIVTEPIKVQEILKQFYLSTPVLSADGKGIFDGSEIYNSTSISSLYHFVLINEKSADFTFLNTPNTVKDALTLPERYLQPACEYTGLNSKATKIITSKAGRAIKEGNNWKVITKAEIKFE